jgi:hypothetical protein
VSNERTDGEAVGSGGLTDAQILEFCANAAQLIRDQVALLQDEEQAEHARQVIVKVTEDVRRATSKEPIEPEEVEISQVAGATALALRPTCCSRCYTNYVACGGSSACLNQYNTCMNNCNPSC